MPDTAENGAATPQEEGKTFTQEQVNAIVSRRLAEEKNKADVFAQRDQAVQQLVEELATAKGTIASLTEKAAAYEQTQYLESKGTFEAHDLQAHRVYIAQMAKEKGVSFNDFADEYISGRPLKPARVPATATFGGTGKSPMHGDCGDQRLRYAMGLKGG